MSASHSPTHPALDLALGRTSLDSLTSLEPSEMLLASTEKDNSLEDRWPGGMIISAEAKARSGHWKDAPMNWVRKDQLILGEIQELIKST